MAIDPALQKQLEQRGMTSRINELNDPAVIKLSSSPKIPTTQSVRTSLLSLGLPYDKAQKQALDVVEKAGAVPLNDSRSALVTLKVPSATSIPSTPKLGPQPLMGTATPEGLKTVATKYATPEPPQEKPKLGAVPISPPTLPGQTPSTPYSITPSSYPAPKPSLLGTVTPEGLSYIKNKSPEWAQSANTTEKIVAYKKSEDFKNAASEIGNAVIQAFPRAVASAVLQGINKDAWQPDSLITQVVFGDKPVESLLTKVDSSVKNTTDYLTANGVSKTRSDALAVGFAPIFVTLGTALDLLPVNGAESKIIKSSKLIAKLKTAEEILPELKTIYSASDDILKPLAQNLTKVTDPVEVEKVLTALAKLPKDSTVSSPLLSLGDQALAEMENIFKAPKDVKPTILERIQEIPGKLNESLVSRFAPVGKFEKQVGVQPNVLPTQSALELFAGAPGKAEADLKIFDHTVLKPVEKNLDDFNNYLGFMRFASRLKEGEARKQIAGWTLDKVSAGLDALKTKVGDEVFKQFGVQAVKYNKSMDEALTLLRDSDVITPELYDMIKANNDFYAKFKVLKYYQKEVDNSLRTGQSISMSRDKVIQAMKGIGEEDFKLQDLLSSGAETIYNARINAEKNKTMQSVKDLIIKAQDKELAFPLRTAEQVTRRQELAAELADKIQETKAQIEKLRIAAKDNRQLTTELHQLEKELETQTNRMVEKFNQYLDPIVEKEVSRAMQVKKIPNEYMPLAREAQQFATWEQFKGSQVYNQLENEAILGNLDKYGFAGRNIEGDVKNFYRAATGQSIEKAVTKPVIYPVNITEKQLNQARKMVDRLQETVLPKIGQVEDTQTLKNSIKNSIEELKNDKRLLRESIDSLADKSVRDLPDAKNFDVVSVYNKGIREDYALPKEVANAIKGLNQGQSEFFGKTLSWGSSLFKKGVTAYNLGFQVVNLLFSDLPREAIMFKYGPDIFNLDKSILRYLLDVVQSFFTSFKGNFGRMDGLYLDFLKSGAANSTIARELNPEAFAKTLGKDLTKKELVKKYTLDNVSKIANAIEETTKILGFKHGMRFVKKGEITMEQLADEVRKFSGSPDFLRKGSKTDTLNTLFMFFNARMQGAAADIGRLAGATGRKDQINSWAKLGVIVGIPTMYNTLRNKQKYELDLEKINPIERQNYHIIFKDSFKTNDNGELVREYYKIPKRETEKLFANLVESAIDFAYNRDFQGAKEFAIKFLEDVSPINITGDTLSERTESLVAGTNPVIKTLVEQGTGRNTFFHTNLEPDYIKGVPSEQLPPEKRYLDSTPKFYRTLGEHLKVSPIRLMNIVSNLSGNLFTQSPYNSLLKRFVGSGNNLVLSKSEQAELERYNKTISDEAGKKFDTNVKASELFNQYGALPVKEQRDKLKELAKAKQIDDAILKRYTKLYEKKVQDWSEVDYALSKLQIQTGVRAKEMYRTIKDLPIPEQKKRVVEWAKKGLATDSILEQLNWLHNNPKSAAKLLQVPPPPEPQENPMPKFTVPTDSKLPTVFTPDGLQWQEQVDGTLKQLEQAQ